LKLQLTHPGKYLFDDLPIGYTYCAKTSSGTIPVTGSVDSVFVNKMMSHYYLALKYIYLCSPNGTTILDTLTDADGKYIVKDVVPCDHCVSMTILDLTNKLHLAQIHYLMSILNWIYKL